MTEVSATPGPRLSRGEVVLVGLAACAAGVLVVLAVLSVMLPGDDPAPDPGADKEAFLSAYARSRTATYAMEGEFTRTMRDGRQLRSAMFAAQRPPDTIRHQLGAVSGSVGGRTINCSTGPAGDWVCGAGAPAGDFAASVEAELTVLRGYFEGPRPSYALERTPDGCFHLVLVVAAFDPVYGERSTMCFDAATGAMTRLEVHREGGAVDLVEARSVRGTVVDSDFAVVQDDDFAPNASE